MQLANVNDACTVAELCHLQEQMNRTRGRPAGPVWSFLTEAGAAATATAGDLQLGSKPARTVPGQLDPGTFLSMHPLSSHQLAATHAAAASSGFSFLLPLLW